MRKQKWLFGITLAGLVSSIFYGLVFGIAWNISTNSLSQGWLIGILSMISFGGWFSGNFAHEQLESLNQLASKGV